jgi:endonuclease I
MQLQRRLGRLVRRFSLLQGYVGERLRISRSSSRVRGVCSVHLLLVISFTAPACQDDGPGPGDADAADGFDADGGEPEFDGLDGDPDGGETDPWADWDPDPRCYQFQGLDGQELLQALFAQVDGHQALSYDSAREALYSTIDNQEGQVQCVYTGEWVITEGIPDPAIMNTEHTWCQSWGADTQPAKSDLNNLYPVLSHVNRRRSNTPFGEVVEIAWEEGGSLLGRDGTGRTVFEPRDPHKGDCARSMFYFALRYEMELADYMEEVLRFWNRQDRPDEKESQRNADIEEFQLTRNPFVDCPELVDRVANF